MEETTSALVLEPKGAHGWSVHDGLGSQLFGAALLTHVSEAMTAQQMRERFTAVHAALDEGMDRSHRAQCSPGAFGPAVMALLLRAERVRGAAGTALETDIEDEAASLQLNSRSVFHLLRAMQEAMTNIARHAHAAHARVRIALQCGSLLIRIEDDGDGFVPDHARSGHGLENIARHLLELHGSAKIDAIPLRGCTVALTMPLEGKKP
jgi:signal transduction histidine kinase